MVARASHTSPSALITYDRVARGYNGERVVRTENQRVTTVPRGRPQHFPQRTTHIDIPRAGCPNAEGEIAALGCALARSAASSRPHVTVSTPLPLPEAPSPAEDAAGGRRQADQEEKEDADPDGGHVRAEREGDPGQPADGYVHRRGLG